MHNIPLNPLKFSRQRKTMSSLDAEKDAMSSFRCPIDVSMMVTIDHKLFFGTLVTCDIVKRNVDFLDLTCTSTYAPSLVNIDPASIRHWFQKCKHLHWDLLWAAAVCGCSNFDWFAATPRLRPGMVAMVEVGFQICMKFPKLWTKSWM